MSQPPFKRIIETPVMIRSRRDIVLPALWYFVSVDTILTALALAAGARAAGAAILIAGIVVLCFALFVQRRPTATLWLDRSALRASTLSGRIEIDSENTAWSIIVRKEAEVVFESRAQASKRGGTAVVRVDAPTGAERGDRVSVELRGSGVAGARFSLLLTG